jgi:tRNA modification GTPase
MLDAASWPALPLDIGELVDSTSLLVLNKLDLRRPAAPWIVRGKPVSGLSLETGEGLPEIIAMLQHAAREVLEMTGAPALTRARHREALERCVAALERAAAAAAPELVAEDLRLATRELGRINGKIDVEDLLDLIFREFCIGK